MMKTTKSELHPRSLHKGLYDFKLLIALCPNLAQFIGTNKFGNASIDYTNSEAVKVLNQALLKLYYQLDWDLPTNYLCPPIPGRVDYIHYLADLLASFNEGVIPKGKTIKVLDIGVGANCIYPLLGHQQYGWSFIGTDIDKIALAHAQQLVEKNGFADAINLRIQDKPTKIFHGVVEETESFDITLCNPPFHASSEKANKGTTRKWNNLGLKSKGLNFGGRNNELWCEGGEKGFIKQMIEESRTINSKYFTTLVSKVDNLSFFYKILKEMKAVNVKTVEMAQGQKKSRFLAWSFNFTNKKKC